MEEQWLVLYLDPSVDVCVERLVVEPPSDFCDWGVGGDVAVKVHHVSFKDVRLGGSHGDREYGNV